MYKKNSNILARVWWLNGKVLDLGSRDQWFETRRRPCVVSLSRTLFTLLRTGSTQLDRKTSLQD